MRAGLTAVDTEMAGAETVTIETLALCRRGTRNVLAHLGVLPRPAAAAPAAAPPVFEIPDRGGHLLATVDGVFEPFHELGTTVSAGQPAGRIHCLINPAQPPVELTYGVSGVLYGRRHPGRVTPGNCCAVVVIPFKAP